MEDCRRDRAMETHRCQTRKTGQAVFNASEFTDYVESLQGFQTRILNRLQRSGQTAFYISYDDLHDLDVINGLATWLGAKGRLKRLDQSLKPQNPKPLADRVENIEEMRSAVAELDRFNLTRTPNFEPRRGPSVPAYVAAANAPVLFMPVAGGPETEIRQWLAGLDGVTPDELESGMNQKRLRQWKRKHPKHKCFTVLRHPLARAHAIFRTQILSEDQDRNDRMRDGLTRQFRLKFPNGGFSTVDAYRAAFLVFLDYAQANMAGQTALPPDSGLSSQSTVLSGFGEFALPDFVIREDELDVVLPMVARLSGCGECPNWTGTVSSDDFELLKICNDELEEKAAQVYRRDYMMFGFGSWRESQAA